MLDPRALGVRADSGPHGTIIVSWDTPDPVTIDDRPVTRMMLTFARSRNGDWTAVSAPHDHDGWHRWIDLERAGVTTQRSYGPDTFGHADIMLDLSQLPEPLDSIPERYTD